MKTRKQKKITLTCIGERTSMRLKMIAGFMAVLFTFQSLLWGNVPTDGIASLVRTHIAINNESLFHQISNLPEALGSLSDARFSGFPRTSSEVNTTTGQPFVIHIQDAHANPEAQARIRDILNWIQNDLVPKAGLSMMIATEGTVGAIHPEYLDLFSAYPKANEAFVRDLQEKGELNGVELFAWERYQKKNAAPVLIRGIENAEAYRDNLKQFRSLLFKQSEIEAALQPLHVLLETAGSQVLNPALRHFVKERENSRNHLGHYFSSVLSKQAQEVLA